MELDDQLKLGHLLLEERVCRICKERKNLLNGYYRVRKNMNLSSSYSYECKECARLRIKDYYSDNTPLGICFICDKNTKLVDKICRRCNSRLKQFEYNIDILKRSVLYLEDSKSTGTSK